MIENKIERMLNKIVDLSVFPYDKISTLKTSLSFNIIASFFLIIFSISNIIGIQANIKLAFVLFGFFVLQVVNFIHLSAKKDIDSYAGVTVYLMLGLNLIFLLFGDTSSALILWQYVLPVLAISSLGVSRGSIIVFIYIVIAFITIFFNVLPSQYYYYPMELKIRLLVTFFTVYFLSVVYEYTRDTVIKKYCDKSSVDDTTGLYREFYITDVVKKEIERHKRSSKSIAFIKIKIKDFGILEEQINRLALKNIFYNIANIIKNNIRSYDYPARLLKDEFLIIAPNSNKKNAYILANRLENMIYDFLKVNVSHKIDFLYSVVSNFQIETYDDAIELLNKNMGKRIDFSNV